MRQVIPFTKDIVFKTKLDEITSISLEHTLKLDNENFISGEFVISGDYKITSNSNKLEAFSHEVPFDIALNNSYEISESTVDIEDFYYEIINDDTLRVNIEVSIEGEMKKQEEVEEVLMNMIEKNIEPLEIIEDMTPNEEEKLDNREDVIIQTNQINIEEKDDNVKTLFSAINSDEEETFMTYHVHIVKENEDMETILKKYSITKEEFLNYNNPEEIILGNKLIIPSAQNE